MNTANPINEQKDHHRLQRRCGFTLVELLVVLTVMVTLGGMLTLALASAANDARLKRTEADVLTIGQIIQTKVNDISLDKVEITYSTTSGTASSAGGFRATYTVPSLLSADERARLVLYARRDLLRMVLPQCRADLLYPPATLQFAVRTSPTAWASTVAQVKPPRAWDRMRTLAGLPSSGTLNQLAGADVTTDPAFDALGIAFSTSTNRFADPFNRFTRIYDDGSGTPIVDTIDVDAGIPPEQDRVWTRENESAECLYLILATTELFGQKAIDRVASTSIGDTDGDGFLEVLDAWENPYEFIRSPAGLDNPAIKNLVASGSTPAEIYPSDPDPFDFLLSDWRNKDAIFPTLSGPPATPYDRFRPFYLPPAIISSGADGEFGIRRTYWIDEDTGTEQGVDNGFCSSAVQFTGLGPAPTYTSPPAYGSVAFPHRVPDPFFDVSSRPFAGTFAPYLFDATGIETARAGGGLGGTIVVDQSADNITSLDGDF